MQQARNRRPQVRNPRTSLLGRGGQTTASAGGAYRCQAFETRTSVQGLGEADAGGCVEQAVEVVQDDEDGTGLPALDCRWPKAAETSLGVDTHTGGRRQGNAPTPREAATVRSGQPQFAIGCPGADRRSVDEAKGKKGAPMFRRTNRSHPVWEVPGDPAGNSERSRGSAAKYQTSRYDAGWTGQRPCDARCGPTTLGAHANVARASGHGT